jgi:RNA polymerase sigma factor (sigma-70 family)
MNEFSSMLVSGQCLWRKFREGDKHAFEEIYRKYYGALLNYGLKIKPHEEFVKDCIQEIFCDLLNRSANLGNTDNILLYLTASLRRKIFRKLRYDLSFRIDDSSFNRIDQPVGLTQEDPAMRKKTIRERKKAVREMLNTLPYRQKQAFIMRFYLDLEYPDISSTMNLRIQSVRNLIYRALQTLRAKIKEEEL